MVAMTHSGFHTSKRLQLQIGACTEYSYTSKAQLVHWSQCPLSFSFSYVPVCLCGGRNEGWVSAVGSYDKLYSRKNCCLQFQQGPWLTWPWEHIEQICMDVLPVAPLVTLESRLYGLPPVSPNVSATAAINNLCQTSKLKWILCTNTLELQLLCDTSVCERDPYNPTHNRCNQT